MRIDLHAHTEASHDSKARFERIAARLVETGISVQAITDHDEIRGALAVRRIVRDRNLPVHIIVGEEIMTDEGEIIGLFLEERIPAGLSARDTVERIRAQGGLVLLQHGFDPLRTTRLSVQARESLEASIDIVEGFNALSIVPGADAWARRWARERDLPTSAGSDAHRVDDYGRTYLETPDRVIEGPRELLAAIREGTIVGQRRSILADGLRDRLGKLLR